MNLKITRELTYQQAIIISSFFLLEKIHKDTLIYFKLYFQLYYNLQSICNFIYSIIYNYNITTYIII